MTPLRAWWSVRSLLDSYVPNKKVAETLITAREKEYARLVCRTPEPSVHEVAENMGLSPKTVENHRCKLYRKLGVHTRIEFFYACVMHGIVACCCNKSHTQPGNDAPSLGTER